MRCIPLACASLSVVIAVTWSFAQDDAKPVTQGWQEGPELRPGEIVIKRTGKRKRVVVAQPVSHVAADAPAELPYEGQGPRVVTIGYMVRDPGETGWGPQVHWPVWGYGYGYQPYSDCGLYGYNSYPFGYAPSYGSYCGPSFGSGFFGSPSFCGPTVPLTHAFRR